jgi:hypothetical protein
VSSAQIASAIQSFRRRALSGTRPINHCVAAFFWDERGRFREPRGVRLALVARNRSACDAISRTASGVHVHATTAFIDSLVVEGGPRNETGAHRDVYVFRRNRLGFLRLVDYRIDQIWLEDPVSP